MTHNGYVYETFGISKHFTVKPLQCLLDVTPLKLALSAKCFIHDVTNWALLSFNGLRYFFNPVIPFSLS